MTRRFVLLGHPVSHSVSPAIHEAAYRELGMTDASYLLRDAPTESDVRQAAEEIRRGALTGANVTVPWKRTALRLADRADPLALAAGAANVLARDAHGAVVAYNTDVLGIVAELERLGCSPGAAVVLGNGGAARAAVLACRESGVRDVLVVARRWALPASGGPLLASDGPLLASDGPLRSDFEALGATALDWPVHPEAASFLDWVARAGLIVQATSAGMRGADRGLRVRDLLPWQALDRDTLIYDLVYNPEVTPLLARARSLGLHAEGGLGMLVEQARRAIELWLGSSVRREPLVLAASSALASLASGGSEK